MGRRTGLEGSVREHPPGSKQWRVRLPARLDPHRRQLDAVFPTKREARQALNREIADLERGLKALTKPTPGKAKRTMAVVLEEYIADRRADSLDPIAINTVRDYREVLRNVVCHPRANLGRVPVAKLDAVALDTWIKDLAAQGLSRRRTGKALAIVRAALAWEVRRGGLAINPAREVRRTSTKAGRSSRRTADPVLLPSWGEIAALASHPQRWDDRLLILLIAWAGLRWTEAVSLSVTDLWDDRPRLTVRRVLVWNPDEDQWEEEDVKGGNAASIPLPTPLWEQLRALAATREIEDRLGGDLLFRPTKNRYEGQPPMIIDHTDWSKRVWHPARKAAGLIGDPNLPELDPRHRAIHIKDLRAYAASVVVDSGGTVYEAASLLRHTDVLTTNRFYARAQDEHSHDPERSRIRIDQNLTLPQRIDALWTAWATAHPSGERAVRPNFSK